MYAPYEELNRDDTNPEIVENLIQAIVLQAIKDINSKTPFSKVARSWAVNTAKRNRTDAINFFNTEWFNFLTGLEGKFLFTKLSQENIIKIK